MSISDSPVISDISKNKESRYISRNRVEARTICQCLQPSNSESAERCSKSPRNEFRRATSEVLNSASNARRFDTAFVAIGNSRHPTRAGGFARVATAQFRCRPDVHGSTREGRA